MTIKNSIETVKEVEWGSLTPFWTEEITGMGFCDSDCGVNDACLDYEVVASYLIEFAKEGDLIPHSIVVKATMNLWDYEAICAFFHMGIEDAAKSVYGTVTEKYPYEVAITIIKTFSNRWNGCPEKSCNGDWDEYGELPRV